MGHEFDPEKVEAWRYRDYVIRAFNRDLPYDHFIREQLAGDLLPRPSFLEGRPFYDPLAATGFLHLYEERNFADDLAEVTAETVYNQIDVLSKSMMGLTVSCAKCHDHKFDPIPTSDYYSLAGVMHSTRQVEVSIDSPEDTRKITVAQDRIRAANREIFQFMEPIRAATAKDIAKLLLKPNKAWRDQLELAENDPTHVFHPFAILAKPSAEPFSARVVALKQRLERGLDDWKARGDVVFADFRTGNYDGWETHGPAFRLGAADSAPPPNQPAIGYRGGGLANSFGGASKTLTGTLVSRSFTVPKQYMHARMSGSLDETRWREHGTQRLVLQIAGRPGYFTQ